MVDNGAMRILVDDTAERDALLAALEQAGCRPLEIGRSLELAAGDGDPTPLEVRFFLRAWELGRPEAGLELV